MRRRQVHTLHCGQLQRRTYLKPANQVRHELIQARLTKKRSGTARAALRG
jgi:hypothetical protein